MFIRALIFSKRILFDGARVLKLQRPICMFMKTDAIKKLVFMDLIIDLIKSSSYFLMYFWEWTLMIGGILVGLLAVFLWLNPTSLGFLLANVPMIELLGIEPPLTFFDNLTNFIFHPFSWAYFYLNELLNIFNNFYLGLVKVHKVMSYTVYPLNFLFYYMFFGPFILFTKVYYFGKSVLFSTIFIGMLFFINKCYMVWDTILQQSDLMMDMIPNLPNLYYKLNNCILYGIINPIQEIARSVNGSKILFIWNLIPSEAQIVQITFNALEIGRNIIEEVCMRELLEMSNFDNPLFKFTARLLLSPCYLYFKVGGNIMGTLGSWLSKWL